MSNDHGHPAIPKLCDYLSEGKINDISVVATFAVAVTVTV